MDVRDRMARLSPDKRALLSKHLSRDKARSIPDDRGSESRDSGLRQLPRERFLRGIKNRVLQWLSRSLPGDGTVRVLLHRLRGVQIGKNTRIGTDVILETSWPHLIKIGDDVSIGMRVMVVAHFREIHSVVIEDEAFIGPGAIISPNVTIGRGAVVTAGSVVNRSVPPMTVVQGNPAVPIARCGVSLQHETGLVEFSERLIPLTRSANRS